MNAYEVARAVHLATYLFRHDVIFLPQELAVNPRSDDVEDIGAMLQFRVAKYMQLINSSPGSNHDVPAACRFTHVEIGKHLRFVNGEEQPRAVNLRIVVRMPFVSLLRPFFFTAAVLEAGKDPCACDRYHRQRSRVECLRSGRSSLLHWSSASQRFRAHFALLWVRRREHVTAVGVSKSFRRLHLPPKASRRI